MIRLEKFTEEDFETLISWIDGERSLMQFAGPALHYPLTKNQLAAIANDNQCFSFKVIENESNRCIGHAQIHVQQNNFKLCRLLIGDAKQRNKGYGQQLVRLLLNFGFNRLAAGTAELNVYEWNKPAIHCYQKIGFTINPAKWSEVEIAGETWKSLNMVIEKNKWQRL